MKTKLCLLLLALCLGLTACSDMYIRRHGPQSETSGEPGYETTVKLWTNRHDYDLGEPVHIRFTVKNTSGRHLVLRGEGEPAMDIVVVNGGGGKGMALVRGKDASRGPDASGA